MLTIQDNLLPVQRFTEEQVVIWMRVKKDAYLWYKGQFGDMPQDMLVKMDQMRLHSGVPVIYCFNKDGEHLWGYLSQFKQVNMVHYENYRGDMFF
jgi:hypothetical protein